MDRQTFIFSLFVEKIKGFFEAFKVPLRSLSSLQLFYVDAICLVQSAASKCKSSFNNKITESHYGTFLSVKSVSFCVKASSSHSA